jgi:hypothetical protein
MESIDPPKQPSPPATFTLRGGCLGAILVYLLSLAMIVAACLSTMNRERQGWSSLTTPESWHLIMLAFEFSLIAAVLGFFMGREGARRKNVNAAFLWGGILCGLATLICLPTLYFTYFRVIRIYTSGIVIISVLFFIILTASGSLVSGLAAIVVRDRREFGRARLIPQFTLQEIFIVFTIASIIISALSSSALLRL